MTAISTILSIIMLPLNLLLYVHLAYKHEEGVVQNLEWSSLLLALAIVITAIGCGLYCSARFQSRRFNRIANHIGNLAGFLLVVLSATLANNGSAETRIWSRHWTFYVAIFIPCLGGLILSNFIASCFRLLKPERVTVAIECCYQNVGIATSLALTMFNGNDLKDAMAVPFLYGLCEAAVVGIYCLIVWKLGWTKAPSNANLCYVLVTSYEVLEYVRKDLAGIEVTVSDSDERLEEAMSDDGNILTTYFRYEKSPPKTPRTPRTPRRSSHHHRSVKPDDDRSPTSRRSSRGSSLKRKKSKRRSPASTNKEPTRETELLPERDTAKEDELVVPERDEYDNTETEGNQGELV